MMQSTMRPDWLDHPIPEVSERARFQAEQRQKTLTKPPGALGALEDLAIRIAACQDSDKPEVDRARIIIFAGDHGIAQEGVSAFPQSVTLEMIRNFSRGGAAISVLARQIHAELEVVDTGTLTDPGPLQGLVSARCGRGTANFRKQSAMTEEQLHAALNAGRAAVLRADRHKTQLLIGGEMGIGNTTAATAVTALLTGLSPEILTGPGTGLDSTGLSRKTAILREALEHHRLAEADKNPLQTLQSVGGFELAALTGCYLASAQRRIPILVDGFISTSAALTALRLRPEIQPWLFFTHLSREPGHAILLRALKVTPLITLDMSLGEGSGAAVALPLLRMACALHNTMATFSEAGVSNSSNSERA